MSTTASVEPRLSAWGLKRDEESRKTLELYITKVHKYPTLTIGWVRVTTDSSWIEIPFVIMLNKKQMRLRCAEL